MGLISCHFRFWVLAAERLRHLIDPGPVYCIVVHHNITPISGVALVVVHLIARTTTREASDYSAKCRRHILGH